jgi:hypothetical protein
MGSLPYLEWKLPSKNSEANNKNSFEYITFQLFSIDLLRLIQTKAILSKQFSIAPSEIDAMKFWEYEYFMKELNNLVEEENKQNEKQKEQYNMETLMKHQQSQQSKIMRNSQPKMPSIPSSITIKQ